MLVFPTAWGGAPVPAFCRHNNTLWRSGISLTDCKSDESHRPDIPCRAGREPVCLVLGWDPACALMEFTAGPTHILRVVYSVVIGVITITSPALDIAALCLSSWPASDLPFSSNFYQSAYAA